MAAKWCSERRSFRTSLVLSSLAISRIRLWILSQSLPEYTEVEDPEDSEASESSGANLLSTLCGLGGEIPVASKELSIVS